MNGSGTGAAMAASTGTTSGTGTGSGASNLGRDKVWTPDIWTAIDQAVTADVGHVRVAQKVFASSSMAGASSVPADNFDPVTNTIAEGQTRPLVELWLGFPLTQSQADNESTLHTGQKLARLTGKSVALAEDVIIFRGVNAVPLGNVLPGGIQVSNVTQDEDGLLYLAPNRVQVDRKANNYPESIFQAVVRGISILTALGQPGPYALILENSVYADAHRPEKQSLVTPADRITPLVTGGFYSTGTLLVAGREAAGANVDVANPDDDQRFGLLASLGGEPISIYVGVDMVTAFMQWDLNQILRFRVFERVQYVARDPRALVRLEFC
jgi:uncharacterized linocin/CFP29 family protein